APHRGRASAGGRRRRGACARGPPWPRRCRRSSRGSEASGASFRAGVAVGWRIMAPHPTTVNNFRSRGAHLDSRAGARSNRGPMVRLLPEVFLALSTVAVFLAVLAGIEGALRVARPDYLYSIHGDESSNVYSETYGWELRRGFHGYDLGELATVNRQGYRGRAHALARDPARTRVVMVGDSIAYGAGVKDEQTFSARLEARGPRFDVVNLAVGGYGTDQELLRLEREGLRYRPDVVLLHFCLFIYFTDNVPPSS